MRTFAKYLLVAALAVPAAVAQSVPAPTCDGRLTAIRVSTITPNGSIDKFMEAVAAQKAWYKSHGLDDMIFASKVQVRDGATNAISYSDTMAISYHFYASNSTPPPPHDAEWDAFVKKFADTSTIKESYMACIPTAMVPMPGM